MSRVLVVEDDKYFNKLLSDHLFLSGFDVESVLDGEAAFNRLQESKEEERPFDILLLDMLLPKMMGAELLTRLNEDLFFSALRKIAMSGVYKNDGEILQLKNLHQIESYWTKPFELDQLTAEMQGNPIDKTNRSYKKGMLTEHPIEKVYFDCYREAFTGRLRVSREDQERRIYFLNGHPIAADSTALSESFGQQLVQLGFISEETREQASQQMVIEQLHFGEVLVKMGALQKDELFKALRRHTYQLLINSFISRQGNFELEALEEIPEHIARVEFNPFILMLEAQKKLIQIEALAQLYQIKMDMFPSRHPRMPQLLSLLNLSGGVQKLLESLKGEEPLKQSLQRTESKDREVLLRCFYLMESIDMLRWKSSPVDESSVTEFAYIDFRKELKESPPQTTSETDTQLVANYMDTLNQNFFQLLKVSEEATTKQIEDAYRKIRYEYHPDRFENKLNGQSKRILDDVLARLDKAYQTLSQPGAREEYLKTIKEISSDSAADSKRYLKALELFRAGQKKLKQEDFMGAKEFFDKAYNTWKSGIEYKMYSLYSELRSQKKQQNEKDFNKQLRKFSEIVNSHGQVEVGFLLLGHLRRLNLQVEMARDAYRHALHLNSNMKEAENALARLAGEQKRKINFIKGIRFSTKKIAKYAFFFILALLSISLYSERKQLVENDPKVLKLDVKLLKDIVPALSIRTKEDMAKIVTETDWIEKVPAPVLHAKCRQILDTLGSYGIIKVYIFENRKGLKAFCHHEGVQRY